MNLRRGFVRLLIVYGGLVLLGLIAIYRQYSTGLMSPDEATQATGIVLAIFVGLPIALTFVILTMKWVIDGFQNR